MGHSKIREFVTYLHQIDPHLASQIRGASAAEIGALSEAAGTEFCSSYAEFLAAFGSTPPKTLNPFLYDYDFTIQRGLVFYTNLKEYDLKMPKSAIFLYEKGNFEVEFLLRQPIDLNGDPEIVTSDLETGAVTVAYASFEAELFSEAFREIRLPMCPHRLNLGPVQGDDDMWDTKAKGSRLNRWHDIAKFLGFTLLPQTVHGTGIAYERKDAAMLAYRRIPTDELTCFVGANSDMELKRISQILIDNLDLSICR